MLARKSYHSARVEGSGQANGWNRDSGDIFHFNVVVTLVPLSAHSISIRGRNKSFSQASLHFKLRGWSWVNAVTLPRFPWRALSTSVLASKDKENGYVHSFSCPFLQEKKRFKCHFKLKQLSNCPFCSVFLISRVTRINLLCLSLISHPLPSGFC